MNNAPIEILPTAIDVNHEEPAPSVLPDQWPEHVTVGPWNVLQFDFAVAYPFKYPFLEFQTFDAFSIDGAH